MNERLLDLARKLMWFALIVPPQKEFVTQTILQRHDTPTFVPVERRWRRRNRFTREKELVAYPIAPRYVFAGFASRHALLTGPLHRVWTINGVIGIRGEPMQLPGPQVAQLIERLGNGLNAPAVQRYMRTRHEFTVGDQAEITEGPFAGHTVPIVEITGARAKALVTLFGSEMEIDVPLEILQGA